MQKLKVLLKELKEKAFVKREVTLSSGKKSNFFFDCKPVMLDAEGINLIAECILDVIIKNNIEIDAVAGVAIGGCPLATAVSMLSSTKANLGLIKKPFSALYVRKEAKSHGTQKLVEGQILPGMKVLLLEDVVTSGSSAIKAATYLQETEVNVVGILSLIDRQEGGETAILNNGMSYISIFSLKDFIGDFND
jgi:orotate phosphoribosyltransferase